MKEQPASFISNTKFGEMSTFDQTASMSKSVNCGAKGRLKHKGSTSMNLTVSNIGTNYSGANLSPIFEEEKEIGPHSCNLGSVERTLKTAPDRISKTNRHDRSRSEADYSTSIRNIGNDGELINTKQRKGEKDAPFLNNLRYVQSIQFSSLPTWVMEFSKDNRFLATGGQDCIFRIWEVISDNAEEDYLSLIALEPFREYKAHKKDIVDISWSTLNKS